MAIRGRVTCLRCRRDRGRGGGRSRRMCGIPTHGPGRSPCRRPTMTWPRPMPSRCGPLYNAAPPTSRCWQTPPIYCVAGREAERSNPCTPRSRHTSTAPRTSTPPEGGISRGAAGYQSNGPGMRHASRCSRRNAHFGTATAPARRVIAHAHQVATQLRAEPLRHLCEAVARRRPDREHRQLWCDSRDDTRETEILNYLAGRAHQRPDRFHPLHLSQDGQRSRVQHPGQARRHQPDRSSRTRRAQGLL